MRMSTALVNGNEAENPGHKFTLSDMVGSHFEASKMKNISSPGVDFDKLSPKVAESGATEADELASMKELVVIHLDYIQQQSEQLAKKNKQIDELKNENEMVKQRLARMERRVSLQKTRVEKKHQADGERKRRLIEPASRKTAVSPYNNLNSTLPNAPSKRIRTDRTAAVRIKQEPDESENENEPVISLDDVVTSRVAYHTLVGEKPNCLLKYVKRSRKQKPTHSQLEVPSWRIKHFTSTYSMEGTEHLSDDVFDRRHNKLMADEKKRKRWDVQRIRDQRQREKLKSREIGAKQQEQQLMSLWPQHADGLRLSVTPLVPVSSFGINLPATSEQDFTLPWKEGTRHVNSRRRVKR